LIHTEALGLEARCGDHDVEEVYFNIFNILQSPGRSLFLRSSSMPVMKKHAIADVSGDPRGALAIYIGRMMSEGSTTKA
jgi:hypothetical protein